jgi:hypothetical protein
MWPLRHNEASELRHESRSRASLLLPRRRGTCRGDSLYRNRRSTGHKAVAASILDAVSEHAVGAAIRAAQQTSRADDDVRRALACELEEARYDASLVARRYEVVDPTERLVARELEARWNAALERVAHVEERAVLLDREAASRPAMDQAQLMTLAHDLSAAWNAPGTDMRTKQRLPRILIQEVVIDLDDDTNEAVASRQDDGDAITTNCSADRSWGSRRRAAQQYRCPSAPPPRGSLIGLHHRSGAGFNQRL